MNRERDHNSPASERPSGGTAAAASERNRQKMAASPLVTIGRACHVMRGCRRLSYQTILPRPQQHCAENGSARDRLSFAAPKKKFEVKSRYCAVVLPETTALPPTKLPIHTTPGSPIMSLLRQV